MSQNKKRSLIFSVLTILSMLGGFIGVIIGVLSLINIDLLDLVNKIPGYSSIKSLTSDSSILYPYCKIVLYSISFVGAFFMFKNKKSGLLFYIVAQLILLIIPYIMWNKSFVLTFFTDLPDMIFTFAFIFAYLIYYPDLKKNQDAISVSEDASEAIGSEK